MANRVAKENRRPCVWFVDMERPKCGDPAAATRKVTSNIGGGKVQVTVDMCAKHLHVYDEISASIRQARQQVAK